MVPQGEIVRRGTIFVHPRSDPYARDADRNFNHTPSIVLMPDNRLLTMWLSSPWEGHHWGAFLASYSSDGGDTWSGGRVFQDTHWTSDFDPGFIRHGDGVWLFYAYAPRYTELAGQQTGRLGCWMRSTHDSGMTWSDAVQVCAPEGPRSNGIALSNGDLIIGVYAGEIGQRGPPGAGVLKSSDGGRTWRKHGHVVATHGHSEPTIVELSGGELLMFLRSENGYIWQASSVDGGEIWSKAAQTDMVANNSSHCLYRMRDGRIALAYNPCEPQIRSPLVLRISDDDAKTWSEPLVLDEIDLSEEASGRWAVCYPSLAENADGDLVAVWARYWVTATEHCGDICFAQIR